jgi:transcription elongation factor GreA
MRIPYRKPGKFSQLAPDPMITQNKFLELKNKLAKLKQIQPPAVAEVARLAELGDFSENAEYQMAKGRLRGINNSILKLENQINQAQIINIQATDTVQLGNVVTVESENKQKKYQILGSTETDPKKGIISHHSPIGSALMGREVGDIVTIKLENREIKYKIINISY